MCVRASPGDRCRIAVARGESRSFALAQRMRARGEYKFPVFRRNAGRDLRTGGNGMSNPGRTAVGQSGRPSIPVLITEVPMIG